MGTKLIAVISFVLVILSGCSTDKNIHEVLINKESFSDYPAVFLNLRTNELIKIPANFAEQTSEIDADLYIEPGDPEIACVEGRFGNRKYKRDDVKLQIVDDSFDNIKTVKNITFQKGDISRSKIVPGTVFVVQSLQANNRSLFKVEITSVNNNKGKEEIGLKYSKLN